MIALRPFADFRLRICTFGGASSLPLFAAKEKGFFAAHGLDVEVTLARSSDQLMQGLLDGEYQIVHAAPDNFVAWSDRTGAPILAWLGGTSGPLRLVADPSIGRPRELAGREVAVDATGSGFVSILRLMLRSDGIGDDEVALVPLGSTELRLEALREGRTSATMLTLPWSIIAASSGFHSIADQHQVLPRLQGSCAASLETWLAASPDVADAYLRSICTSLTWMHTPGHEPQVRDIIARRYAVAEEHADQVRREILDPVRGWPPSAMVDPLGIEAVCKLRRDNGDPPRRPATDYYTFEPYRRVLGFGLLGPY